MWFHTIMVAMTTCFLHPLIVQSQVVNAQDGGTCGVSKGCFVIPPECDTKPGNTCTAFSSWSVGAEDGLLFFNLITSSDNAYIAIGFSKSGGMDNSDVYACTSNKEVVRSRNVRNTNSPQDLKGVSEESVVVENGFLTCTFKRQPSLEANNADGYFFNLSSGNTYTPLLAWGSIGTDGNILQHNDRRNGAGKLDFSENKATGQGSTVSPLQKLHGVFMVFAWMGFASIGITTARFFKKSLPGELCGKPSWFAVHRFCMVSAVTLGLIAYIVIIIDVQGYIKPGDGKIRFTHAILGTIVTVLGPINAMMALFRPHPGEPRRNLFNWAHWGVGTSAHLLGAVTIMLGTSNRENQGNDVLLRSVPRFVFAIVVTLVFFHLAVWIFLTIIDLLQKKKDDGGDIPMQDNAGPNANSTTVSTTGLADQDPPKEPVIKLAVYGVYVVGIAVGVIVIVLAVIIAN